MNFLSSVLASRTRLKVIIHEEEKTSNVLDKIHLDMSSVMLMLLPLSMPPFLKELKIKCGDQDVAEGVRDVLDNT